jgi:hypothetical protein
MHLDGLQLDRYLARSLDRATLRSLDDHVAGCLACLLAVESSGLQPARWQRRGPLGRLVRVEPERASRPAQLERAA